MGKERYFHVKTTTSDGVVHDSKKEADRWCELKLFERAGKISDLKRQVPYELIPAQYETVPRYSKTGARLKDGQRCAEKGVVYICDFEYIENGKRVVEDVKSPATRKKESYIIKRKLMRFFYGIAVREV